MSEIRPLPGIHYTTRTGERDLSARLAPPYDVLDAPAKQRLLDADAANFVKVDLPHMPPKTAGPEHVYAEAAAQVGAWLADGTLMRDATPAIYVYHQSFRYGGRDYVRKMFFARLRLEEFGKGSVFPHEQTFGGPKADRLLLTKATQANMSPIFGLYPDEENVVAKRLEGAIAGQEPLLEGRLDDTENRVWAVTEPEAVDEIRALMRDKAMFIADGHHRYGTAMNYKAFVEERDGQLAEDHPANFVLCVCCAMGDPGLLILPTHRVLPGKRLSAEFFAGDANVELRRLDATDPDRVPLALAEIGPQAIAIKSAETDGYLAALPARADLLDDLEPDHCPAWRRLALAFLHAYVIDRAVKPRLLDGAEPELHYVKQAVAAVREADETGGTVFLMPANTMEELRGVCEAGDLMPQKSTFFYPKLASGLIINPLT